jgi:hypothetical protein
MDVGVDLQREAPVPADDDMTIVDDGLDDTTVSDSQPARAVADTEQLDARARADAGTYPSCEEAGTVRIHVGCIGWKGRRLDGHS